MRNEHTAESISEDAIARAAERVSIDRPTYFLPWLHAIARHMAFRWKRSLRINEKAVFDLSVKMERSAFSEIISRESLDLLDRNLSTLTKNQRLMLLMRIMDHLSYQEIGDRLNLKASAVRATIFRARKRLTYWLRYMQAL